METLHGVRWPAETVDGRARVAALAVLQRAAPTPSEVVEYQSQGELLIIADYARAEALAATLGTTLSCTLLAADAPADVPPARVIRGSVCDVEGHLGAFHVTVRRQGTASGSVRVRPPHSDQFDLVLDLTAPPRLDREILPPGYFAPGADPEALQRCLEELPTLVGTFQKPKFFRYNPDICAHGRSGIQGCSRCLQACPTAAIVSVGERIEVNPYLCQGAGSCTTVCPSGAIGYDYPPLAEVMDSMRRALKAYRDAGAEHAPSVVLHDGDTAADLLEAAADELPEWTLPVELEGVASAGMDLWLAALAYGAVRVLVLAPPAMAPSERRALQTQMGYATALLTGMGYGADALALVDARGLASASAGCPEGPLCPPGTFAGLSEKRTVLRLAIGHLHTHAPRQASRAELPPGAPFGEVRVDSQRCTLCMSCVSVCPTSALADGGEAPRLGFVETNCVQCGLCSAACPEGAIDLHARIVYAAAEAGAARVLNEEQPFHCVVCGKPFATRKMIDRMSEKLAGHWMFRSPEALRRLQMCEDCRVQEIFAAGGGLEVYDRPRDS